MTDDILFDRENTLAQITLNRPKALNALTLDMIDAMGERLTAWETDPSISCVLIRPAAGGRAFAAGGDIERVYRERGNPYIAAFFWNEYIVNWRIHHYTKPYVAFMDGIVMGGGVGGHLEKYQLHLHEELELYRNKMMLKMPQIIKSKHPEEAVVYGGYLLCKSATK